MDDNVCLLITLLNREEVITKCAIKIPYDKLPKTMSSKAGNKQELERLRDAYHHCIWGLLPLHVRDMGHIINIEQIHEVDENYYCCRANVGQKTIYNIGYNKGYTVGYNHAVEHNLQKIYNSDDDENTIGDCF